MAGNTHGSPGTIKDSAEHLANQASKTAADAKNKVQDVASTATEKAKDAASNIGSKAQDLASNITERAHEFGSTAAQKTEDTLTAVGERMSTFASTIRESAPREGTMGTAATAVADQLQAGGRYLQDHDLKEMADDIAAMVRRHPMQSVLVGFGIGILAGMAMLPSNRR